MTLVLAGLGATALVVLSFVFLFHTSAEAKARRSLRAIPPLEAGSPVGSVARVTGEVVAIGPPAQGPLTNTPCVYFDAEVKEQTRTGSTSRLVTVLKLVGGRDFLVRHSGGEVRVLLGAPEHRAIHPVGGLVELCDRLTAASPRLQQLLRQRAYDSDLALSSYEYRVAPGDTVIVAGVVGHGSLAGSAEQPLVASNQKHWIR